MTIHYKVVGEGEPVVLLHGWSLDHRVMLNCLEPVFEKRSRWKRIYIDLPGMGRSKPQESVRNSDDLLNAVLECVDQIIPNEPFIVGGYSYGGYLARGIAHFRRELVRGMLLFAPVTVSDHSRRCLPEKQILREDTILLSRLSSEDAVEFCELAVLQGDREWERFYEDILAPSREVDHAFLRQLRNNGYGFTFDMNVDAPLFEHTTLVICGRQDHIVGYKDTWQLIDKYPKGTFALLDRAGHNLQIEQPRIFEALVNDWMDRLESEWFSKKSKT